VPLRLGAIGCLHVWFPKNRALISFINSSSNSPKMLASWENLEWIRGLFIEKTDTDMIKMIMCYKGVQPT
jgi:hypothetical protein